MRILLQPAFILHQRPYRNTSLLLDVLTQDYGRVALIAKGVRSNRKSNRGLLQPFNRLLLSYSGRGEIYTLTDIERDNDVIRLSGKAIFSGLYLNELLSRLMHRHDPHELLFEIYYQCLRELSIGELNAEPALRRFELQLLQELGYGLLLTREANSQADVVAESQYYYDIEQGPIPILKATTATQPIISGRCLLALAAEDFSDADCINEMKRLMRAIIAYYLQGKPLKSRELFKAQ